MVNQSFSSFLVIISILLLTSQRISAQYTLTVDPGSQFQQIDGFGASDAWRAQFVGKNWPEAKREQIAELLFSQEKDENDNPRGIGLSIWRFYISAGTTEQGEASGIKNEWRRGESFVDQYGNYDWSKQAGQQWFLHKAKDYGVDKFLAFSIAAPVFWAENEKGWNSRTDGNLNLKKEHYHDYSRFLVETIDHFKKEGISFDYLSPINEPQWDWERATQEGTPATNDNIAELVGLLSKDLFEKDLGTKIVVPEAADLRFLYSAHSRPKRGNQIGAFFQRSSENEAGLYVYDNVIPTLSGHSYFTTWPVDSLISIRQRLKKALSANNLGYWQSEFCILEKNDDIVGGGSRDLGMGTALYVARVIHADLTLANARSWQWWTALTIADFKDGLIYLDTGDQEALFDREKLKYDGKFHASKLLWALGNYSRFVRPGMQRVLTELRSEDSLLSQYKNLMFSAYTNKESGEIVVVGINYSDQNHLVNLENQNVIWSEAYETSEEKNLEKVHLHDGGIQIPARSIITLLGQINSK